MSELWLTTSFTDTMWQESATGGHGSTHALVDTDPIGRLDSPCGPHMLFAGTGTTDRPTLASDATKLSSFLFTRASSQKLEVYNSKGSFRCLHDGPYTLGIQFKRVSAGTRQYLIDTSNDTVGSGNYGMRVFINTDNTLWIDTYGGHATNYLKQWNVPTFSFTDTASWHTLIITVDAIPGTQTCQYDNLTAQTSAIAATNQVATGQDAKSDLRIGADMLGGGHYLNAYVANIVIEDSVLSAGNIAAFKAYNPARSSGSLSRYTELVITNPATQLSPKPYVWFDFSDTTGMWQESTKSTATTADGHTIGWLDSKGGSPINRHAIQATASRRPLYKTNIHNGKSAGLWAGDSGTGGASDDLGFTALPKSAQTYYLVCENTVVGTNPGGQSHEGSHFLTQGSGSGIYLGMTGVGSSNGGNPNRIFKHIATAYVSMPSTSSMVTTGRHLVTYQRNGSTQNMWYDGIEVDPTGSGSIKTGLTAGNSFGPNHMGDPAFAGVDGVSSWWDLGGYVDDFLFFNTTHNATERGKVEACLRTKWGTP